jgi:hypothetical protein
MYSGFHDVNLKLVNDDACDRSLLILAIWASVTELLKNRLLMVTPFDVLLIL